MIRLFRVFIPISTFTLFIAEILLTNLSFLAASYAFADVDPTDYLFYDGGIIGILIVTGIFVLGLYFNGLYSGVYVRSKVILLYQLFLITGLTFLFEGLISSVASEMRLPIRVMITGSALSVLTIYAWRLFFSRYAIRIVGNRGVLLVGGDPVVEAVGRYIETHPQSGLRVAGYVAEEGEAGSWLPGVEVFGRTGALAEIIREARPDSVVVGTHQGATTQFARVLEDLRYSGENIQDAAQTYEKVCGRVWVQGIQPAELIYSSSFGPQLRAGKLYRFFSPLGGLLAGVIFLPAMAFTWLVLRLSSSGPVLQREARTGLGNRPFTQYHFRLPALAPKARESSALTLIRKFRLDGLPQLFNVLKGDMAFVGPRAERPEFVEVLTEWIPYYPQRHCVPPGMTGWAQIQDNPRVEDTLAKLEYDLYYIKNLSLSMDTVVIFQTIRSMFLESPTDLLM